MGMDATGGDGRMLLEQEKVDYEPETTLFTQ